MFVSKAVVRAVIVLFGLVLIPTLLFAMQTPVNYWSLGEKIIYFEDRRVGLCFGLLEDERRVYPENQSTRPTGYIGSVKSFTTVPCDKVRNLMK